MFRLLHIVVAVVSLLSIIVPSMAVAQARSAPNVSKGVALRDVLASWGEPDERIVRSVKKELVWRYKGGAFVVFKEGKVTSFKTGTADQGDQVKKAAKVQPVKKREGEPNEEQKHILQDILDEIPGGADGSAAPPPPPSDPSLAGLIPNPIPSRNGPPAGLAPGVVIPSIEEEADQMEE